MVVKGGGIGNSVITDTTISETDRKILSNELSNSALINTVKSLVATTISTTLVANTSKIQSIISANNAINLVAGPNCPKMSGGFTIKNVDQVVKIDADVAVSKMSTLVADITSNVNNNVNSNVSNIMSDTKDVSNTSLVGTTFEGIVGTAVNAAVKVADTVADVLGGAGSCIGIANDCDTETTKKSDTLLQNKYGLDTNFSVADAINNANITSSDLTINDIDNILSSILGSNSLIVKNICPRTITIANIEQTINIDSLLSNSTISTLSTTIATNYINKIEAVLTNMQSHKITDTTNTTTGDIAALGSATAAVIRAGGKAVAKTITASGKAGGQVLSTVGSESASQIGAAGGAIASLASNTTFLILGGSVFFIILGIIIFNIFFSKVKSVVVGTISGIGNIVSSAVSGSDTKETAETAKTALKYFYKLNKINF
jgi:hypothetical protein